MEKCENLKPIPKDCQNFSPKYFNEPHFDAKYFPVCNILFSEEGLIFSETDG